MTLGFLKLATNFVKGQHKLVLMIFNRKSFNDEYKLKYKYNLMRMYTRLYHYFLAEIAAGIVPDRSRIPARVAADFR